MKDKIYKTNSIVEAGILCVFMLICMLLNSYVPFFGFVGLILLPIIIAILYVRHDLKVTIVALAASFLLIMFSTGVVTAISFILLYTLSGIILGYCIKKRVAGSISLFFVAIAFSIGVISFFFLVSKFIYKEGIYDLINQIITIYKNQTEEMIMHYKQMGINTQNINQLKSMVESLNVNLVLSVLPGYVINCCVIFTFLIYKLAVNIFGKLRMNINNIKPFKEWHIDDRLTGIIIGITCIGIILNAKNVIIGQYIINSSIIVGSFIFSIVGISAIIFLFRGKYKVSKIAIGLMIVLVIMLGMIRIFPMIGIIDSIINFRRFSLNKKV
ncbi:DUF2232 domain-containing protein [Haloimpatiens sp. FM7330]|uniref:DUF2232 domain-containing protein n=1 Tax=Haloimpatiens sp. FM7330 TaxID=3298610 RepID=UPI0036317D15